MKTLLSFVIPCYRSELTIEKVINEIIDTVSQKSDSYDYEIICVNDCSPDNVFSVLKRLAEGNKKIKVIDFAKNMGKHAATMAAFSLSKGSYIVTVDDDCQCPVYDLWKFIEPLENDECDFTTAKYDKKKESAFRIFGSKVNSLMSYILIGRPKGVKLENFGAMKKFVMKEIIKYDKPYPYIDGLIYRATNHIKAIPTHERDRGDNKGTGFSLKKCLSLWINGFTAFSVKPLRLSVFIGIFLALIGFASGVAIIVRKLLNPDIVAGYTSSMAMQLFIGGLILMSLGLIGEYVGRIYICLNNSPQYVIKETINVEEDKALEVKL